MVFVTCGMGGGTGTGAAPVIAKIAKDKGILTVGVVTEPFLFEGRKTRVAKEGIKKLREVVDTIIVISNDKLLETHDLGKNEGFEELFKRRDEGLIQCIKGVTDIIRNKSTINLDFADLVSVIKDAGVAYFGIGHAEGEDRCKKAMNEAINNPLLKTSIIGARNIIIYISGDVTFIEVHETVNEICEKADNKDNLETYVGVCTEEDTKDSVTITLIATGMPEDNSLMDNQDLNKKEETEKNDNNNGMTLPNFFKNISK